MIVMIMRNVQVKIMNILLLQNTDENGIYIH